jgi:hypothetical protein
MGMKMLNGCAITPLARVAAMSLLLATAAVGAQAADSTRPLLHAEGTVELQASPDQVWAAVGDFTGIHRWHPGVKGTTLLEGKNKQPMVVRQLDNLGEGQWLISELLDWNGQQHTLRYRILKSPLPFVNYVTVYTVKARKPDGAVFTWKADFRRREESQKPREDDAAAVKLSRS